MIRFQSKFNCPVEIENLWFVLDVGYNTTGSSSVLFQSLTKNILYKRYSTAQFNNLILNIKKILVHRKPGNLWEKTLAFTSQNSTEAIEILGSILQDTSSAQIHMGALRASWFSLSSDNKSEKQRRHKLFKDLLSRYHQLRYNFVKSEDSSPKLLPPIYGVDNRSIHHFYTIALLAQKLAAAGYSDSQAFFFAFLFNFEYEIRGKAPLGNLEEIREALWALISGRIDSIDWTHERNSESLIDIYSGYAGAKFGLNIPPDLNFTRFRADFIKDPVNFVQAIYDAAF